MGKVSQSSVKYVIEARLKSSGLVEKPDIVGAIFGQTEGLLGEDLDLRELQERGRIGRLHVEVKEKDSHSLAEIKIPTSLDATETALIGAALETIERVGPTNADIRVKEIRDERTSKRDYIVKRAKQLLEEIQDEKPGKQEITDEIREEVRTTELEEYCGFESGPDAEDAEEVILVEGRADLLNLLKHGVKNAVAIGGTSVPSDVSRIAEESDLTAFLDGDRGGDLILKELKQKAEPSYVARAPEGKEVEELGKKAVFEALRDKKPVKYSEEDVEQELDEEEKQRLSEVLEDLVGTRAVNLLDEELEAIEKAPLDRINDLEEECRAVVLDGEIGSEVVEKAEELGADYIVGRSYSSASSSTARLLTGKDLEPETPPQETS
ncbi:MAG: DNA primase DnaG [Candidatus Nanohaloarchaea archaeon]